MGRWGPWPSRTTAVVWSVSGRPDSPEAFYTITGLTDPGSSFRLDVGTLRSHLFARPELPYDPTDFVTEQVFYRSPDGTRIPMWVVRRADLKPTGERPVIMYGYGWGWAAAPWFQPQMATWVRSEGIWALPNIRGGTEYGSEWQRAGVGRNRQNAIDDYVAAARWFVTSGWSRPDRVVSHASSAGCPVAAAAYVQHPEDFGALLLEFPARDMLCYDRFTGARAWRALTGTAEDPDDFRALHAYSPLHNLEPGTCYPAAFVAPGSEDETTTPLHAYKFVAALRHAQGCDEPVLLRVSWGAGHAAGADLAASMENWTDQLAFLVRVLDLRGW